MPNTGYSTITLPSVVYDKLYAMYKANKKNHTSFAGWFTDKLEQRYAEQLKLKALARTIHNVPPIVQRYTLT